MSIHGDETKRAEHSLSSEMFREKFFVPQTVLQRQQHRPLMKERRNKIDKLGVGSRLNRNDHEVARTDFLGRIITVDFRDAEVLPVAANKDSVALDCR